MTEEESRPRRTRRPKQKTYPHVRPEELMKFLEPVVGQDTAKRKLVSAFSQYLHYLEDPSIGRTPVLLYGASGSGKTYSTELILKALGLPYTIASSATISPPLYKGKTMGDVMAQHFLKWKTDRGVIFLDEVDKWTRGAIGTDSESVSLGVRCQAEMLKYLEADDVTFMDFDDSRLENLVMETENLMWVFAGAFQGLPKLIRKRLGNSYLPDEDLWEEATPQDFVRYGLIPEFANRIGTWAWTKPLTVIELREVLAGQERPKWAKIFKRIGCDIEIQEGALSKCAMVATEMGTGAKGAASLLRRCLEDVLVEVSRHRIERYSIDAGIIETGRIIQPEIMNAG